MKGREVEGEEREEEGREGEREVSYQGKTISLLN